MNKFLQTALISTIFTTSGFASVKEVSNAIDEGTKLDINGNVEVNSPISVGGTLEVQGGALQNNNVITFKNRSSLLIKNAFKVGDLVGTITNGNCTLADISSAGFNKGYWEFVDSSNTTYSDENWSSTPGVSIQGGKFQNRVPLTAETYEQVIENLKNFECSGSNIIIDWTDTSDVNDCTGTLKQNSTINAPINDGSYADCFPTQGVLDFTDTHKGPFSGPIEGGTVKLSCKATADFRQMSAEDIVGVYEYKTKETDYVETIVNDTNYIIAKRTNGEKVLENAKTQFKSRFNDNVTLSESIEPNFYAFGDEDSIGDKRRSFTGLIGSTTANLNAKGNILSTANIIPDADDNSMQSAISGVTKNEENGAKILSINRGSSKNLMEIRFSLEGSDNLEFQDTPDESIPNSGKLTFLEDNSKYTGTASVSGITSITAYGNNALPHKLAEDFSLTEFIINSGENTNNTIDNKRETPTTIKSLQLNSGNLTIAEGTTIVIGSNS